MSRTVPGLCRVIRIDEPELVQGWTMFTSLLGYWQAKNRYWPQQWEKFPPTEGHAKGDV